MRSEFVTISIACGPRDKHWRRPDMYLSTLRRFIEAMGGELVIHAKFESGDVGIDDLSQMDDPNEVQTPAPVGSL